ncbi:cell division cycle-associated 7-like protein [Periophthalmus magnuspinnatus]|uniref:cell division cycle-associated 7-like protein n=1 Tax=Periophthalmus magnuspinnatus TaxID=409849 RepID=UPI00145B99FB|nr:cell division cycle-associated 7-like protein [Periophthalmus magnuspinnatus]
MVLVSKTPLNFRSRFITPELTQLFSQSDSEEEFEGFSENEDDVMEMVESEEEDSDTNFYSDGEESSSPKSKSLLVALRFPFKRPSASKQQALKKEGDNGKEHCPPCNEQKDHSVDEDVLSQSLKKRNKNIQENKAMLAKLFADLSYMAVLTPPPTPQKKKSTLEKEKPKKRKFAPDTGSERRNPSRKARPPEKITVEEDLEPVIRKRHRRVDLRALVEVDEERATEKVKRRKSSKRCQYYVRSVDEITEEELDNIAYRSKDKIWDKENGSSCHQCRQKTLDTKSVCRSGFCTGVKGQFCGPCLNNRYGEDVRTALLDPTWSCPICRGMCNCSLCRKKEGRCATGILVQQARFNGHGNVHEYLESIKRELQ